MIMGNTPKQWEKTYIRAARRTRLANAAGENHAAFMGRVLARGA